MYVVGCYEMFWVGCMWLVLMKCLVNVVYVVCMLGDVRVQGSGLEDGQGPF